MSFIIYIPYSLSIIPRVNSITNKCKFDILRIDSKDILCQDYGYNKKYCNSKYIPDEFIIYNENSINGKKIVIRPRAIWHSSTKIKMMDFYFSFTCDQDNFSRLIVYIIPIKDFDYNFIQNLIKFIFETIILITLIIIPIIIIELFNSYKNEIMYNINL
tara:strand:+ start:12005 stop:12481 length:477 start_codon:yes stop_codon:yes gene_type:complete